MEFDAAAAHFDALDDIKGWLEAEPNRDWHGESIYQGIGVQIQYGGTTHTQRDMWAVTVEHWEDARKTGDGYYYQSVHRWEQPAMYETKTDAALAAVELVKHVHRDCEARRIEII